MEEEKAIKEGEKSTSTDIHQPIRIRYSEDRSTVCYLDF